jgi:hypothetical protein
MKKALYFLAISNGDFPEAHHTCLDACTNELIRMEEAG